MHLGLRFGRVDRATHVLYRGVTGQLERSRLRVGADSGDVYGERRRCALHGRAPCRVDGAVPAHELGAHGHELGDLDKAVRHTFDGDAPVDYVEVFGCGFELFGRDLEQLADGQQDAAVMSGWRREVIGQRLLAAL